MKYFPIYILIIITLLSVAGVYGLHRYSDGIILSSKLYTAVVFILFFLFFSRRIWPWMKLDVEKLNNYDWIFLGVLSLFLVTWVWSGRPIFGGDYLVHHQYIQQLRNGFKAGHDFYKGFLGYYPPLPHALTAILSNIDGLGIHHNFLILTLIIAFIIPLVSCNLAQEIGLGRGASFFFAALISIYGGFGRVQWNVSHLYLPGIQLSMPFISRNLGFLMFLIYLLFWSKIFQDKTESLNTYITIGILAGIIGLIHPQPFIIAFLLLAVILLRSIKRKKEIRYAFYSFSLCITIALLFYAPLFMNIIFSKGLKTTLKKFLVYPSSPLIYGPVVILAIFSLVYKRKNHKWVNLCIIYIIAMCIFALLTALFGDFEGTFRVFRFHKFGTVSFVFLAVLASYGFEYILCHSQRIYGLLILALVLVPGLYSNMSYINLWYEDKISVIAKILKGKKALFPAGKADTYERLRLRMNDTKKTVIVPTAPKGLAKRVAFYLGVDVPYVDSGPKIFFKNFFTTTISQEKRREYVEAFYKNLNHRTLPYGILELFKSEAFFAKQKDLDKIYDVAYLGSITFGDDNWHLYELQNH